MGGGIKVSLSFNFSFVNRQKTLPGHITAKKYTSKETPLYTLHKGSYTVEAAVVIPFLTGFLMAMLFFFRVLQVQSAIDEALYYAGRKVAAESSITDSKAALLLSTEAYLYQVLEEYECIDDYVSSGFLGISLLNSDFTGEKILLRADYSMKLPVSFFGMDRIRLWQQNAFRKWTGDQAQNGEEWVYVTSSGEVYHSSMECRSIKISVKASYYPQIKELRGENGQKYYECSHCAEEIMDQEKVYYTDYGVLYHFDISCSAIKRSVTKIDISEVGTRRKCSFCYRE